MLCLQKNMKIKNNYAVILMNKDLLKMKTVIFYLMRKVS